MAPLEDFPANHCTERNDLILNIINNQPERISFSWHYIPIETPETPGHKAILQVSNDALKIDGIRINVSAALMQSICDIYGCILPTAKICDLIYKNADIKILPCPRPISSTTKAMIAHSLDVDKQLVGKGDIEGKLISTVGKNWVISNLMLEHKPYAINYGWHFSTPTFINQRWSASVSLPNVRVIQPESWAHDAAFHTDYSQICRLISRNCEIDGGKMDIVDVLQNKELANIFSHQGVLNILRIP